MADQLLTPVTTGTNGREQRSWINLETVGRMVGDIGRRQGTDDAVFRAKKQPAYLFCGRSGSMG